MKTLLAAGGRRTIGKYLASGRIGSIGHVSIEDHQAGSGGAVDGSRYWLHRGGPLLAQACDLLGTGVQDVMARIDEAGGVTEAYLATHRGVHVHYSGLWNADVESHCLWIEGTGGSLKADARAVWWRKRGWRFFIPVRLGGVSPAVTPGSSSDRETHGIATAALASAMSRRPEPVG